MGRRRLRDTVDVLTRYADEFVSKIWGGDWCKDCRTQLPDFAAALDAAEVPRNRSTTTPSRRKTTARRPARRSRRTTSNSFRRSSSNTTARRSPDSSRKSRSRLRCISLTKSKTRWRNFTPNRRPFRVCSTLSRGHFPDVYGGPSTKKKAGSTACGRPSRRRLVHLQCVEPLLETTWPGCDEWASKRCR